MSSKGLSSATEEWNRCLEAGAASGEIPQWFCAWQESNGLVARGKRISHVLRPLLVPPEKLEADRLVARALVGALTKASLRIERDPAIARRFLAGFYESFADLIALDPGYPQRNVLGRIDILPTAGSFAAIEYNSTPGGVVATDGLADLFIELGERIGFARSWRVEKIPVFPRVKAALLGAYRSWGGRDEPFVVFALPRELASLSASTGTLARALAESGTAAVIADPEELEFDGESLRWRGRKVGILIRVFFPESLARIQDRMKGVIAALRAKAVCMVASFRNTILSHKTLFAMLTDPSVELPLTEEERRVVKAYVPWTRVLAEGPTTGPSGREIDIVPWALESRQALVGKPSDAFGGAGVLLGWTMPAPEWSTKVGEALRAGNYLLQSRVEMASSTYPAAADGIPQVDLYGDQNFYVCDGDLAGYLCRLSPTPLTNMTLGASAVPALLVTPRAQGTPRRSLSVNSGQATS